MVYPSATSRRYSLTWPSMKTSPMTKVIANHLRNAWTLPFSAAKTPIWQVTEESTRIVVNVRA